MPLFEIVTADTMILAFVTTVALRQAMIAYLQTTVVGPNGWLLRIATEERD